MKIIYPSVLVQTLAVCISQIKESSVLNTPDCVKKSTNPFPKLSKSGL